MGFWSFESAIGFGWSGTTKGSGKHVCCDYQGCTNYPVKFCTFDGGLDDRPKDSGASTTWTHDLTWSFLKQF